MKLYLIYFRINEMALRAPLILFLFVLLFILFCFSTLVGGKHEHKIKF